ncbi:MAG: hypothetical protein ACJA2F_000693, partial [Nitriliruptoraceae bacterium]
SDDDNETWDFVPRTPVSGLGVVVGAPATGFSDPEFAIDKNGTVYVSEINLANIAVSKSIDGGRSYELVNAVAFTSSDRQWMAADRGGELYMAANGFGGGSFPADAVGNVGHFIAKSTDGGRTWGAAGTKNGNGEADIQIDQTDGILYELSNGGGGLQMAAYTNIREEAVLDTVRINMIAAGANAMDPTFDLDDEGNLYASWYSPSSEYGRGVFYAASTDQGVTWSTPVRVDTDDKDEVWPWIAVGAPGEVTIAWLQNDFATTGSRPGEAAGTTAKWDVMVAHSSTGLGCADDSQAAFSVVTASSEPVHTGTICQHGTTCQADLTDRRLGDYFAIEVGSDGRVHVAVSDTREGGAIALPLHIRQTAGPRLFAADGQTSAPAPDGGGSDTESGSTAGGLVLAADGILAATGGGAALTALSLLGMALVTRRRRD